MTTLGEDDINTRLVEQCKSSINRQTSFSILIVCSFTQFLVIKQMLITNMPKAKRTLDVSNKIRFWPHCTVEFIEPNRPNLLGFSPNEIYVLQQPNEIITNEIIAPALEARCQVIKIPGL